MNYTDDDISQKWLADEISFNAHGGQLRRDGVTPYRKHIQRVANKLDCNRLKAVAYLHDVLEDTDTTVEFLRKRGVAEDIIAAVQAMTKQDGVPYEEYIAGVSVNEMARKVKIADMIDNLSDDPTEKQIVKYAKGLLALTASPKTEKD